MVWCGGTRTAGRTDIGRVRHLSPGIYCKSEAGPDSVPHYFIEPQQRQEDQVTIDGPLYRHLAGALRLRVGETVTLVDGDHQLQGKVIAHADRQLTVAVISEQPLPTPRYELTLLVGMPKGRKLEEIVKRAVELGVRRVQPVITARSIARGKERERADRLASIALEAAQQSGRERVPEVCPAMTFKQFLAAPQQGAGVVLYEREKNVSLVSALSDSGHEDCSHYRLFIGPEGGLSEQEVDSLMAVGFVRAGLGPYVLRSETACFAALAVAGAVLEQRFRS